MIFDDEYGGDMGRCRDDLETDLLDGFDTLEDLGCEYDPKEARECIREARRLKSDCSDDASRDIVDACDRVFDCPGALDRNDEPSPELTTERRSNAPTRGPVCEGALTLDP